MIRNELDMHGLLKGEGGAKLWVLYHYFRLLKVSPIQLTL